MINNFEAIGWNKVSYHLIQMFDSIKPTFFYRFTKSGITFNKSRTFYKAVQLQFTEMHSQVHETIFICIWKMYLFVH